MSYAESSSLSWENPCSVFAINLELNFLRVTNQRKEKSKGVTIRQIVTFCRVKYCYTRVRQANTLLKWHKYARVFGFQFYINT